MKWNAITVCTVIFLLAVPVSGQQSGNNVFGQSHNNRQTHLVSAGKLYLSDTSFVINANVLINVIADNYVATFGVSQSSETLKEANTKIDIRIRDFISALEKTGIAGSDIYIDMTTQTQISDYRIKGDYAEQYISGFEQKKNVIVRFSGIEVLDKMIVLASDYDIYDLAKVDYILTDINEVYSHLFEESMKIINRKKELYVKATGVNLSPTSAIYGESFYSYTPQQLYKSYTPNRTTAYYNYNSSGKRKDLMQNTTFYYDKINYSGFDKVIDPAITEPAVEFVMALQIKFNIKKE